MSDELIVSLQSSMQSHPTLTPIILRGDTKERDILKKKSKNLRNRKEIIDRK